MPSARILPFFCSIRPSPRSKWIPRVEYTGFVNVGQQLVAAVLEADRTRKKTKPGRIVLLHHLRSDDPYLKRSYESLLGPCQAAGKPMEVLEFDGDVERGMAVLRKSLEANPAIDILLADDAVGVHVGFRTHIDWTESGHPGFLFAGYTPYDYRIVTFLDRVYAIGNRSVESYASKTCQAILSLMDAKPVRDVIRVPVEFNERPTVPSEQEKRLPRCRAGRQR